MVGANSSETPLDEIQRQPLRHRVRARIEDAIVEGIFQEGDKLNEAKLCRALGVSRGLVREALRELETSGVLVSVPFRGSYVREWTPQGVWELYSTRSRLEEFAGELAAERATETDFSELAAIIEAMKEAAHAMEVTELVNLDIKFHRRLHETTGHSLLRRVLRQLDTHTRIFIIATEAYYAPYASLQAAAASHERILEPLRARDADGAREAIHQHVWQVGERYVERRRAAEAGGE